MHQKHQAVRLLMNNSNHDHGMALLGHPVEAVLTRSHICLWQRCLFVPPKAPHDDDSTFH